MSAHPDGKAAWLRAVRRAAVTLAVERGCFTADELRDRIPPPPPGVGLGLIGNVLLGLQRDGLIYNVGYTRTERASHHGNPQATWRGDRVG